MEKSSVERLDTLLINRAELLADPGTLARIELTHAGRHLVVERRAGALVAKSGDIPETALTPALEALGGLRAEAAVHTGPPAASEGFASPWLVLDVEPSPGLGKRRAVRVGSADSYRGDAIRYARVDGVNATFAVAEPRLAALIDLF
jgi:hypothetical protein